MKINYFAVNNFRGISGGLVENTIVFKDTNTLIIFGKNNTGKSSFLKAYDFFYTETIPKKEDYFNQDIDNEIVFEIEVQLEELDFFKIEYSAPKQKDSYKKYLINNDSLRIKASYKKDEKGQVKKYNQTWNPINNNWDDVGYASVGLHNVFQSCMPKPIFIKAMPNEEEVRNILNQILRAIAESKLKNSELNELTEAKKKIEELQSKMYNENTISAYERSVNMYFKKLFPDTNIEIVGSKSKVVWSENKFGKDYDIEFKNTNEKGGINNAIPSSISTIGHGTIRSAIFTLLLMKDVAEEFERKLGRKDYLVLFEEPELFLYPKIIKELRNLIYQVSQEDLPYQVLCASHSPQMIDLSKPKSSIIRLTKNKENTRLFQINDKFLKQAKQIKSDKELKESMYEVLRFNPYICESFYADEVILIEGPTEEIIVRAYLQEIFPERNVFVLNCGSVTNIPFYQKIFSQFSIKYNVICDTDGIEVKNHDTAGNPYFESNIQGSISKQFHSDKTKDNPNRGLFRVHITTFEPAHQTDDIDIKLRYQEKTNLGKPYNANLYWKDVIYPNLNSPLINQVPIIKYLNEIITKNE